MSIPAAIESGGSAIVVGNGNGPSGGAGPVERLTLARPALPCPGCVHAPVCSIRPLLDVEKLALRSPASPHEAILIRLTLEVECSHFLAGEAAPALPPPPVGRMAASRKRGACGLVKARAVKAERHAVAGGGSRQGAEPGEPQEPRDAGADAAGAACALRARAARPRRATGWIGAN